MRYARSRARGQAVVETALGVLLLVTVTIFSIHFGEIGYAALKTQEAANAALWNSTAGKMHQWGPGTYTDVNAVVAAAQADAQGRYVDFDGRASAVGGGTLVQSLTDSSSMNVQCALGAGPPMGGWGGMVVGPAFIDNRGLTCRAEATVNAGPMLSTSFMDGATALFRTSQGVAAANNMKVCAIGRATGGSCHGNYSMMLDDWGAESGTETRTCQVIPFTPTCTNTDYYNTAHTVYNTANPVLTLPFGSLFAFAVIGWSPISPGWAPFSPQDENQFYMGAAGEETVFMQIPIPLLTMYTMPHGRPAGYGTSPGVASLVPPNYAISYGLRLTTPCFLGQSCT